MTNIFEQDAPIHPLDKYKRYTKFQLIERITELNELVIRARSDADMYHTRWIELVKQNEVSEVLGDKP
jgi:hypothetical protein